MNRGPTPLGSAAPEETTMIALTSPLLSLLVATAVSGPCVDPLPIDPGVVTRQMNLKAFNKADQAGPACHLSWEGGSTPSLMIYGPTPMAELGRTFSSTKQAADEYAGESPTGAEPLPGVKGAYMVFDPATPNRR